MILTITAVWEDSPSRLLNGFKQTTSQTIVAMLTERKDIQMGKHVPLRLNVKHVLMENAVLLATQKYTLFTEGGQSQDRLR